MAVAKRQKVLSRQHVIVCGLLLGMVFGSSVNAEPSVSSSPDYQPAIKQLSTYIEKVADAENIPGLSIALVDGDHIVWSAGFGYADVENKIAATPQTVYRQGAITGTLTALAVMQLVAQNKIELDAPLNRYLPEFSMIMPAGQTVQQITIRRLLSHHAGLPLSLFNGMWTEQPDSLQQLLPKLQSVPVSFPADQVYAYSNLGYDLLGRVIEVVSGRTYVDYVQQEILDPLKMSSSGFAPRPTWNVSAGYKKTERKPLLPTRDLPALGLYASVEDLAVFLSQLMARGGDGLLPEYFRRQMISPQNEHVALDLNKREGFAWRIGSLEGLPEHTLVWRQGATLTHRSRVAFLPELGLGVVISANSSRAFGGVEKIADEALLRMLEARVGKIEMPEQEVRPVIPGKPEAFAPAYAGFLGLLQLEADGKNYDLDLMGWGFSLIPRGDGWYRLEYDLFGFIPIKLDWIAKVSVTATSLDGRHVAVVAYKGVNYLFAESLSPMESSDAWLARQGRYAPVEMDALLRHYDVTSGELKFEKGFYFFEYKLPYWVPLKFRLPLLPVSDNEMRVAGIGTGLGEQINFLDNERVQYSGYELKRVKK